jgi:hypothetical protein
MNMPGMTGEASVYRTSNVYRSTGITAFPNNSNTTVTPQDCGLSDWIGCGLYVGGVLVVCGSICAGCLAPAGTIPLCTLCAVCVEGLGVLAYETCHDCLPGFITSVVDPVLSGGGGPPPPDCTTTGCKPGLVCCDCVSPARCTTPARCHQLCQL